MYLRAQSAVTWIGLDRQPAEGSIRHRSAMRRGMLCTLRLPWGHREGLTHDYDRMGHVVTMPGDSISKCLQPVSGYTVNEGLWDTKFGHVV